MFSQGGGCFFLRLSRVASLFGAKASSQESTRTAPDISPSSSLVIARLANKASPTVALDLESLKFLFVVKVFQSEAILLLTLVVKETGLFFKS